MVHNGEVEATVVKARFGADVRKMTVHHNDDLSYNDLLLMMQRIFKMTPADNICLRYKDQEGDLITMADDHDLLLALQNEPSLSLVVSVEGADSCPIRKLQGELEVIRDSANALLDMLKRMGPGMGDHITKSALQDRPDTPRLLNESVATIQPSVHEQVNNGPMAMSHPPAPCAVPDAPPMDMTKGFESISQMEANAAVPPPPKCGDIHSFNEPSTEVDISSNNLHTQPPPVGSLSQHTGASDHSESSPPMSQGLEPNGVPQPPSGVPPMAPIPTMNAFPQPPQAAVPPTSALPPQQQQVPGMPPSQFGAPPMQQNQQQQHPPPPPSQMQQSFGNAPVISQPDHQGGQPFRPPSQPLVPQPQTGAFAPQIGGTSFPPASIPPPPSSTPSGGMFGGVPGIPSMPSMQSSGGFGQVQGQGGQGQGGQIQGQGQGPPPPPTVSQMSQYSASSTPTPMQSTYNPPQGFRSGTPSSYGGAMTPVQQQQQQGVAPPPAMMPPSGAPPMMPFAGGQGGVNPFGRGAGHYPRPPFAGFQQ